MKRIFTIKHKQFELSEEDVKEVASSMNFGTADRVRFYAKVAGKLYPARQLVVQMLRRKGETMPDIITYQAIRILRALGIELTEL